MSEPIPEEAIEAAAVAICTGRLGDCLSRDVHREAARAALAAALPSLRRVIEAQVREQVAQEIEAASSKLKPATQYREGIIDGHWRAAQVARGSMSLTKGQGES